MRKSNYLQLSETKDRESYNLLLNCCHVSRNHLNEYISNNRINAYLKEKLIERIQTKDRECFRLTDKGYKRFEKEIGSSHFRYHSRSIEHDLKLSDKYIEIMRDRNNEWKNEEDLKQERKQILDSLREEGRFHDMERLSMFSVPDCVILGDISYGFDIVTDNYSNSQIESKEEYCELMNLECKFEKI